MIVKNKNTNPMLKGGIANKEYNQNTTIHKVIEA